MQLTLVPISATTCSAQGVVHGTREYWVAMLFKLKRNMQVFTLPVTKRARDKISVFSFMFLAQGTEAVYIAQCVSAVIPLLVFLQNTPLLYILLS